MLDPWVFLQQLVNFLVLTALLYWLLHKPLSQFMEQRKRGIATDIEEARKEREAALEEHRQYAAKVSQAHEEAQQIIDAAVERSKQLEKEMVAEAKEEIVRLKNRTQSELEQEKQKAISELTDHVAALSVAAAGKIISKNLDVKTHEDLLTEFINQLEQHIDSEQTGEN